LALSSHPADRDAADVHGVSMCKSRRGDRLPGARDRDATEEIEDIYAARSGGRQVDGLSERPGLYYIESRPDSEEFYRTFNCGIGMVVCVAAEDAQDALACLHEQGERAWVIGRVEAATGPARVTLT
jgi:hypothetical protein